MYFQVQKDTRTLLSTCYSIILYSAQNMASQVRETFCFDVGSMFIRHCGHHFGGRLWLVLHSPRSATTGLLCVCRRLERSSATSCEISWTVNRRFLMHGGLLTCEVTERRKVGHGLEVPCRYTLTALHVQVHWAQKLNIMEQLTYL